MSRCKDLNETYTALKNLVFEGDFIDADVNYATDREHVMMGSRGGYSKANSAYFAKDVTLHTNDGYPMLEIKDKKLVKFIQLSAREIGADIADLSTDDNLKTIRISLKPKGTSSMLNLGKKYIAELGKHKVDEIRFDSGKIFIFMHV